MICVYIYDLKILFIFLSYLNLFQIDEKYLKNSKNIIIIDAKQFMYISFNRKSIILMT